jgi:2-polyprenyl-6-methoxyphenol hydroxylase-like FAD-dependent oxidoreductase
MIVDKYWNGSRCFLAGDACHIHSPAGGQGMNTGNYKFVKEF